MKKKDLKNSLNKLYLNSDKIDPNIPINIHHRKSHEDSGLQACDMFCYEIFSAHENNKEEWRDIFKSKILFDQIYLG
jgi:hypothetical protein